MTTEEVQELPIRVLGSARRLFVQHGYDHTSLAQIARGAGSSESSILRVFGTKNWLLQAVFGLCWAEKIATFDATAEIATQVNQAPGFVTIAVIKGWLERYEAERPQRHFLLRHFSMLEVHTGAIDDIRNPYIVSLLDQWRQYRNYLTKMANDIVADSEALCRSGIVGGVLAEILEAVVYGTETNWYMYDRGASSGLHKVKIDDVVCFLSRIIYGAMDKDSSDAMRRELELCADAISGLQVARTPIEVE